MGVLDDAIREHLDLKRRHGADPSEIERAEREALGPVRRAPEETDQVEDTGTAAVAYDHEGDGQDWGDAAFDDEYEEVEEPPTRVEGRSPRRPEEFEEHDPFSDDPFEESPPAATPPPHAAPEPPPRGARGVGDETAEYDVEDALESEHRDEKADDVLEETPEFLQDTPDHDRLWFEQRPPRDFDFGN